MVFNKICILHLNQIGDLIFSLPLLKALRNAFPKAEIHSVVKPYLEELLACSPLTDRIIHRSGGVSETLKLFKSVRKNRYDLVISLSRSYQCLGLAAVSGARVKAGFPSAIWGLWFNFRESIEGHNCWYNNSKLLKQLNIPVKKNDYVGLLKVEDDVSDLDLPERFVVISPGASKRRQAKAWEPENYAKLMLQLFDKYKLVSVLVGSKDNEKLNRFILDKISENGAHQKVDVVDLTGRIGLGKLASVLKQARLFVGIDSGVMHMASSLDIPVVGLFGPTDSAYVGPQNNRSVVVKNQTLDCIPCYLKDCDHKNCMAMISVDNVFRACEKLSNDF